MAQLPPKAPSMAQNWPPCFPHQRLPPDTITPNPTTNNNQQEQPCWMDEFLDFSAVRRGSHRRSASDSIAFLEAPLVEECRNQHMMNGGFDRLDDEQLMSMFSDDINIPMRLPPSLSSSNPSSPSDQNSNNEEKAMPMELHQPKPEPGEVESSCMSEPQQSLTTQPSAGTAATNDTAIDPKRVKRILANRQSAQRSRVRKLQYISELERSVTTLQSEVSVLSPRVAFLDHQRLILNVDNSALKQRIAALAQDKIFKEAHQEALRNEIERLRQVYNQQNLKNMRINTDNAQPNSETMGCTDSEMLPN